MKKDKGLVLVLCRRCKDAFEQSGHIMRRTRNEIKEPCYICSRQGWEYKVKEIGNEQIKG